MNSAIVRKTPVKEQAELLKDHNLKAMTALQLATWQAEHRTSEVAGALAQAEWQRRSDRRLIYGTLAGVVLGAAATVAGGMLLGSGNSTNPTSQSIGETNLSAASAAAKKASDR